MLEVDHLLEHQVAPLVLRVLIIVQPVNQLVVIAALATIVVADLVELPARPEGIVLLPPPAHQLLAFVVVLVLIRPLEHQVVLPVLRVIIIQALAWALVAFVRLVLIAREALI